MNRKFYSEPVYGDKYIKAKLKSYEGTINTNFRGKKRQKKNTSYKCLSLIMLYSVLKVKIKSILCKHF